MMTYLYIFYILFNVIILSLLFNFFRVFFLNSVYRINSFFFLNKIFISFILFILISAMSLINYTILYYQSGLIIDNENISICINSICTQNNFIYNNSTCINNIQTYYYPFIYVFLIVTVLSIAFCLSYNNDELITFMFYCIIILSSGYLIFFTDSLIIFFLAYEMLLVPSFFILYKFAKTRRCVEASYLMFFWTQFGAMFIIFAFLYMFSLSNSSNFTIISYNFFSEFEVNFFFLCFIIGFGVKLPIWPFYGWLPKAHVEASTNFSIFLSGVLVKFAFFGLLKCLFIVQMEPTFIYIYPFLLIGITDSVFKLFYQIDLKKLVAYSTVVEMHWLTMCVISGQSNLMIANFCMLISHALLSTNFFLIVDAIARRFKTRLITEISGLNFLCPKLFIVALFNCLIFLGFPGSIFFLSEFLFFSFFFDLIPSMSIFLIILLYLIAPTFFFRSWFNVMFGKSKFFSKKIPIDITTREFLLLFGIQLLMYWLGVSWQSFVL